MFSPARAPAASIFGGFDALLPSGGWISRAGYARTTAPTPVFEGDAVIFCEARSTTAME